MTVQKPLPSDDLDLIIEHTREIWRNLSGTRFFITGGTGFIGTWLLESITHANKHLQTDIRAVVLTRTPNIHAQRLPHIASAPSITFCSGDVLSFNFPDGSFDGVIHAATDVGNTQNTADYLAIFDVNVSGTRRVLDFAIERGATRFLLTSSGAVYGVQPPALQRLMENWQGAPDPRQLGSAYGEGKRAAEWLSTAYARQYNLEAKIARIFALIGPGMPLHGPFAAGNFIRDALEGKNITVNGDGSPRRSYLYAADMAIWLWHIFWYGKNTEAYNLGATADLSIKELAEAVQHQIDPNLSVEVMQSSIPNALPARYIPDTSKAQHKLGVREYTPFSTALQKTIDWNRG
ncbi:NAD-dependent epimerase/dehydratase family protein [Vogesella facilis]|uniref:NAD-dependent epimerase/dehydratase family protein n=1 Tax=Vogesella facilis TaxID=1655232 RepID=A0ABV7RC91_9NEIS